MAAVLEKASTISVKGQTTVPVEVREVLGLSAGDRVTFCIDSDRNVTLHRADEDSDPALGAFLGFLASDIQRRPHALRGLSKNLKLRLRELTAETIIDRDEQVEGDVGL